jgi:hypothetical protein
MREHAAYQAAHYGHLVVPGGAGMEHKQSISLVQVLCQKPLERHR